MDTGRWAEIDARLKMLEGLDRNIADIAATLSELPPPPNLITVDAATALIASIAAALNPTDDPTIPPPSRPTAEPWEEDDDYQADDFDDWGGVIDPDDMIEQLNGDDPFTVMSDMPPPPGDDYADI